MILLNKPVYLMPFIYVYKMVRFLFVFLIKLIKYINVGFFITLFIFIDIVMSTLLYFIKMMSYIFLYLSYFWYKFLKYLFIGFIVLSRFVYLFIKYVVFGFVFPFVIIVRGFIKLNDINNKMLQKQQMEQEKKALDRERNRKIDEKNKKRLAENRKKEKEKIAKKKEELKEKRKADIYINENVVIEKKKLSDYINSLFIAIGNLPKKIKESISNNRFVKDVKNKNDINREALLLDFEGADAEKSEEKVMYKYVAKDPDGKIIKGYFPAYSKVEVHSFLLSEGNEVYSIETNKWIQRIYGNGTSTNHKRIKTRDLIFFCTQLSTYIKAGIPLVEALKILSHQFKKSSYVRIFRMMIYDLTMGDNFSTAMDKQGEAFPRLFINMVKASEMTGELPEVLDDMANYFTESDKTRKQMITAMTYPAIIFVFAIAAVVFIMVWVVPQFVEIYEGIDGAKIPDITLFVMSLSSFLQKYYLYLIIGICLFIIIFVYLYKNVKAFKTTIQWFLMHMPIFGNVIIYNEVTMFTKTFASLLAHNVFITDSMEILNKITNNEIYKMLILDTITNLAKGEKISLAFKDHWAFPIPAYEMIITGERTGQLAEMMSKVSSYYQELHRNAVTRIKTFIEPALILFLTFTVGGIVLSIVIPMFSVYGTLQM